MLAKRLIRTLGISLLTPLLVLTTASSAYAAGPEDLFRGGPTVAVGPGEVLAHDLFVAGQSITVKGTVRGDVAAAEQEVTVSGTIKGDLWAAGQSVEVSGHVQGDVRALGQDIVIDGEVEGNVLAAGSTVVVKRGSRVGGDLVVYSKNLVISGTVEGDVGGTTQEYQLTGTIGGTENIKVEPESAPPKPSSPGAWLTGKVRSWLSLMLVGLPLGLLGRSLALKLAATTTRQPVASLVSGLIILGGGVAAILGIFLLIIAAATVLGLLGLGGLAATAVLAGILAEAAIILSMVIGAIFLAGVIVSLGISRLLLEGRWAGGRAEF